MTDTKLLPRIGSKVKITIDNLKDRLPAKLIKQISNNPHGIISGYKMTDGRSIGLIVKFQSGQENWFFPEELERG
tara:strand:+ start:5183 stop:5407 length:225 start_codon:yes stop_codon:yes gene_type:complete